MGRRSLIRADLDRPGRRWLLAVLGSVWATVRYREPCVIRWRDGTWIHHSRGLTIPHPTCCGPTPLAQFTAMARDVCLHEYTPREGDIVLDVGAGVGTATLLLSRLVGPTGRVIALEAHPATCARLNRLCDLNALTNVVSLQIAAAAAAGEVAITDLDHDRANTVIGGGAGGPIVPAARLDDIARSLGIDQVDFVKMNIEGAEQLAIRGMGELIERTRHVCISCHDFLADGGGPQSMRTKADVREYLLAKGFRLSTREHASDPWTRDYLYGTNTRVPGGADPAGDQRHQGR